MNALCQADRDTAKFCRKAGAVLKAIFFPVGRFEPETVFGHFKLICAFLKLGMSFWQPETIKKFNFDEKMPCKSW